MAKRLHAISYDLSKPGRNYDDLYRTIKSLGGWCHALESTWIASTTLTAKEVRDRLRSVIDGDDHLLVTEMTGDWASYNLSSEQVQWLKAA